MPLARFRWEGTTADGITESGVMAAPSHLAVRAILRRKGLLKLDIGPETTTKLSWRMSRVSAMDIAIFTRELAVMLSAGVSVVDCLRMLAEECESKGLQVVLQDVIKHVEAGSTLAKAMARHPKLFDSLYVNIVAAGEASGNLDVMLLDLADHTESIVHLKGAIRSAAVYPGVVISTAIIVVGIMLWAVVPAFASVFASLDARLPLPTRIVVQMSYILTSFFPLVLGGTIAVVIAARQFYRTDTGELFFHKRFFALPVVGVLLRKIAVARCCRTLALVTAAGVPILDGLQIAGRTAGNRVIADAVANSRARVEAGGSLAEALRRTKAFPGMVIQMAGVGEKTGELDLMLRKVADFFQKEVDRATDNLVALLEPVLIVFLGVVIGGIVISMYLPMFALINVI
jgi:type IV pilus assembly protein PilC